MTDLTIDPKSLLIVGLPDGRLNGSQVAALDLPGCPACGKTRVRAEWLEVTETCDYPERWYVIGRWECPLRCDPHQPNG